ncbi:uncharacterized protein LOC110262348 isoform X2 [Arachis ipaensis]|uniref:uncharacterized protein LOC110262348 isoform X2 n=1 Tax=Arachis ipaensis TaxID=130454 RepID=UPI000A2B3DED|nr:uncharacterized protein LOC110262348 isoform X2 [Arachis ipaensis]
MEGIFCVAMDAQEHFTLMATVESEISEKEKEEIRLLYERAERRRGPAISYFPRRSNNPPNKSPGREADLALNVQKLRSELIHLGLFDEEAPRRTFQRRSLLHKDQQQ